METTTKQAKAGGEYGANGSFYKGGTFINTVAENAKGSAKQPIARRAARPLTEEQIARTRVCIARHEATLASGKNFDGEWLTDSQIAGIVAEMNHYRRQIAAQ